MSGIFRSITVCDANFETMAAEWQSSGVEHPRRSPAPGMVPRVARSSPSFGAVATSNASAFSSVWDASAKERRDSVPEDFRVEAIPRSSGQGGSCQAESVKVGAGTDSLGDTEGPEVDALRSALDRAREQTKEAPVDVQVKEGEQFLLRARAHLAEINKVRATIESNIADTEARLERLKAEVVTSPVQEPVPPPEWATEVQRLREEFARARRVRAVPTSHPIQSSAEAASHLEARAAKRRAGFVEHIPTDPQDVDGWL